MREIYLKGFEICVRETQPLALMTSYNLLNGTHTSERRDLTMDILRAEWGYEGIVMTDWVINTMMSRKSVHPGAVAPKVVKAGGDLFMPGQKGDFAKLKKAFPGGRPGLTREEREPCAARGEDDLEDEGASGMWSLLRAAPEKGGPGRRKTGDNTA